MIIIGCLQLDAYENNLPLTMCRLNDGYLLCRQKNNEVPLCFTLVTDQLIAREQKILSKYGIKQIEVIKSASNTSTLFVYRKDCSDNLLGDNSPRLFLDFYQI